MNTLYKVSTLSDPASSDRELHIERPGWVVMWVRPNFKQHGQVLWADLLDAIKHDLLSSSLQKRAGSNCERLAYAWLAVESFDDIVIAGANLLPPKALIQLCTLTTSLGLRTWLTYDIETCDERAEAEASLMMQPVDLHDFLERRRHSGEHVSNTKAPAFPAVADVNFLGFLDIAEQTLDKDALSRVSERYHFGRTEIRRRIQLAHDIDEHYLAMQLHEITACTNDLNELTCVVKGAQAGLLVEGWHVQVDIKRWAQRGMVAGVSQFLSDDDWRKLSQLQLPQEAAACVLSTLGLAADEMQDVLSSEVSDDGASLRRADQQIDVAKPARKLLTAQHIYRDLICVDDNNFFASEGDERAIHPRWASGILRQVTQTTGVVLRGWNASRKSVEARGWPQRMGISVKKLAS